MALALPFLPGLCFCICLCHCHCLCLSNCLFIGLGFSGQSGGLPQPVIVDFLFVYLRISIWVFVFVYLYMCVFVFEPGWPDSQWPRSCPSSSCVVIKYKYNLYKLCLLEKNMNGEKVTFRHYLVRVFHDLRTIVLQPVWKHSKSTWSFLRLTLSGPTQVPLYLLISEEANISTFSLLLKWERRRKTKILITFLVVKLITRLVLHIQRNHKAPKLRCKVRNTIWQRCK